MSLERRLKHVSLSVLTTVLLLLGTTAWLAAYDLSANTLMIEDGERQEGKIYIKGEKYRIQREGESEYIVLRHDLDIMWVVLPEEKMYVQLPLDPKKTPKIREKNPGEISRRFIGTEMVEGRPTDKYEITVREGSKTESFYQWTATDLNFPVRTSALEGEWSVEFRNIKLGVPDRFFEIPAGYSKARIAPKGSAGRNVIPSAVTRPGLRNSSIP
jgi:hypothetical protein